MFTVKQARLLSGYTQAEIANKMGVNVDTYRRIELDSEKASIKNIKKFCEIVGIPMEKILFNKSA